MTCPQCNQPTAHAGFRLWRCDRCDETWREVWRHNRLIGYAYAGCDEVVYRKEQRDEPSTLSHM